MRSDGLPQSERRVGTYPKLQRKRPPAPPAYHVLISQLEARRIALGIPMERMGELMGAADRSWAKALKPDTPSGRMMTWPQLQLAFNVLYPHGFDLELKALEADSPSAGNGVGNSHGALRALVAEKARWHAPTRKLHMGQLGALGGKARARNLSADELSAIGRLGV